jgi:hypothetical protein
MGIVSHSFYHRPWSCGAHSGSTHALATSWVMPGTIVLVENERQIHNNQLILACNGNLFHFDIA